MSSPEREESLTQPGTGSWRRHGEDGAVPGAVVPTSSLVTALFKAQTREDWVEGMSRSWVKEEREEGPLALIIQGTGEHILHLWWDLEQSPHLSGLGFFVSGLSEVTRSRGSTLI